MATNDNEKFLRNWKELFGDNYNNHKENTTCHKNSPCNDRNVQEICNLFKFIEKELLEMNSDANEIKKAFCKLSDLLFEDECLSRREIDSIKAVSNDIKALRYIISKTLKDLECLKKQVL